MCGHSSEIADTFTEVTEPKHGKLSNEEAIEILSDKCEYMSTANHKWVKRSIVL